MLLCSPKLRSLKLRTYWRRFAPMWQPQIIKSEWYVVPLSDFGRNNCWQSGQDPQSTFTWQLEWRIDRDFKRKLQEEKFMCIRKMHFSSIYHATAAWKRHLNMHKFQTWQDKSRIARNDLGEIMSTSRETPKPDIFRNTETCYPFSFH